MKTNGKMLRMMLMMGFRIRRKLMLMIIRWQNVSFVSFGYLRIHIVRACVCMCVYVLYSVQSLSICIAVLFVTRYAHGVYLLTIGVCNLFSRCWHCAVGFGAGRTVGRFFTKSALIELLIEEAPSS